MMSPACPICRSQSSSCIDVAHRQPALLNRLYETRDAALAAPVADLDFRLCAACGFVWNAAFDANVTRYAQGYVNDQSQSGVFSIHLEEVLARLARMIDARPGRIIEIGCGQGDALAALCRRTGRAGMGFDPAFAGVDQIAPGVRCLAAALTRETMKEVGGDPIALVMSRHVLEHIPSPREMLRLLHDLMRGHPDALLYLEVPCFDWIARSASFFDLFNEHCSLFSAPSMRQALLEDGFDPMSLDHAFDDQYLCVVAQARQAGALSPSALDQKRLVARARLAGDQPVAQELHPLRQRVAGPEMRSRFASARQALAHRIAQITAAGRPIIVWGAGAKGISLVNRLGLSCDRARYIVDIHHAKHGRYVPLTGQKVIGPQELQQLAAQWSCPAAILVMNPNYADEIRNTIESLELACEPDIIVLDQETLCEDSEREVNPPFDLALHDRS